MGPGAILSGIACLPPISILEDFDFFTNMLCQVFTRVKSRVSLKMGKTASYDKENTVSAKKPGILPPG
jgi:hypothetical protein